MNNEAPHILLHVALAGPEPPREIHILRYGNFKHRQYGRMLFDAEFGREIIANFEAGVLGARVVVERDHKRIGQGADGWLESLRSDPNEGLFATIDWTEPGAEAVQKKLFGYISCEIDRRFWDNFGNEHRNVLSSITLSNHPWVQGLRPIMLDDGRGEEESKHRAIFLFAGESTEGRNMGEQTNNGTPQPPVAPPTPGADFAQLQTENAKLSKQVTDLTALVNSQGTQLSSAQLQLARTDLAAQFGAIKYADGSQIPPQQINELVEIALDTSANAPTDAEGKVVLDSKGKALPSTRQRLLNLAASWQQVRYGQVGFAGGSEGFHGAGDAPAKTEFDQAVETAMKADANLSLAQAQVKVGTERPELYGDYQTALLERAQGV